RGGDRAFEQPLDVAVSPPASCEGARELMPEAVAVAELAPELAGRLLERVEQQVRRDPSRPALERVAADSLPAVREQRRPQLLALTRFEQDAASEPLQPGQERLQHYP